MFRAREHVASLLESEGVINDVTAAIAAVVVFETLVVGQGGLTESLVAFDVRFGLGRAVGLSSAGIVYKLLRADITPGSASVKRYHPHE